LKNYGTLGVAVFFCQYIKNVFLCFPQPSLSETAISYMPKRKELAFRLLLSGFVTTCNFSPPRVHVTRVVIDFGRSPSSPNACERQQRLSCCVLELSTDQQQYMKVLCCNVLLWSRVPTELKANFQIFVNL